MTDANAALEAILEPEIDAVRILLEGGGRRRVAVVCATLDLQGEGLAVRSYSEGYSRLEAIALAELFRKEATRLTDIALRPKS